MIHDANQPGSPVADGTVDAEDPAADDVDLILSNFIERIPGASSAVVVTSDGLVLAMSERIIRDSADQLAAVASGLSSLTTGAARCFDAGMVQQIIVEMEGGYLFVTAISEGSALALMCEPTCDIGLIGYEMSLIVARLGQVLTPALIAELHHTFESVDI